MARGFNILRDEIKACILRRVCEKFCRQITRHAVKFAPHHICAAAKQFFIAFGCGQMVASGDFSLWIYRGTRVLDF